MALTDGRTTVYHLNRLAGTLLNDVPQLDFNGAANVWAFNVTGKRYSRGIDALNQIYAYRNGGKNYYYDTPGAFNALAGTFGLGEAEAARRITS
jgi:hypothetical protein